MQTVFRLTFDELSADFLKGLKSLFKEKNAPITLTISDEADETAYLLSTKANRKMLDKSMKEAKSGKLIKIKINELP